MNNKTLSSHQDKASTENVYSIVTPTAYDDEYCFEFSRRGIAVIIINDKFQGQNRYGCDKDLQFLQELFSKFGFEIRTFYDKTGQELLTELKHISTEDHSSYDCFVLAISTHGEEAQHDNTREDVIFTSDVRVKTRLILELFDDENCPTLKDKPRLVFIQACRGSKLDDGVDVLCTIEPSSELSEDVPDKQLGFLSVSPSHISQPSDSLDALPYGPTKYLQPEIKTNVLQFGLKQSTLHQQPSPQLSNKLSNTATESRWKAASAQNDVCIKPVPCFKDCLVMYATPPGFFAFRRTTDGSWFIKCLAEVLLKSDGSRTLLQELTKVISKVSQDFQSKNRNEKLDAKKQSPVIYSMLTKDVYLRPKF